MDPKNWKACRGGGTLPRGFEFHSLRNHSDSLQCWGPASFIIHYSSYNSLIMPNSIKREVAYKENTIAYENELPFPTVLYPYHYGAFLAFSKKEVLKTENIFFCSCHRKAILNFFKMFLKEYSSAEKQYEKGNALLKIAKEFPKIVEDNLRNIIEKEELRLSIDFLGDYILCYTESRLAKTLE